MSNALTQEQFQRLLAALDADPQHAAARYEAARRQLIHFFRWEGCRAPEDWADEVFNRVAVKLWGNEPVANVPAFLNGTARLVAKEALRRERRETSAELQSLRVMPFSSEEVEQEAQRLEKCLQELDEEQRDLILRYYRGDGAERIKNRQKLALEHGISLNSLRNRALRLRDRLESCMGKVRDVQAPSRTKEEGSES